MSFHQRNALAKARCGVAPICIETGRYENGKYLPVDQRFCQVCSEDVEDEFHILLNCPMYEDLHQILNDKACNVNVDFIEYNDTDKLKILMSDIMSSHTAKTCKTILKRRNEYFKK